MLEIIKAYTLSECMDAVAECVAEYEKKGERNLIFCEDRLTLIAERALTRTLGGSFLSSVTTFARFLNSQEKTLTKQGSVMAVGEVMNALQRENALQCFKSSTSVGTNAKSIYETLAQFSASEVTPEILTESAELLEDSALKKKTQDLAIIYKRYLNFLSENRFLDESAYLSLLPRKIREDKNMPKTNVFFLCFSSFTAQATQTIRAVIEKAKNVVGIFCADTQDFYTNVGADTFIRVCKEYGKVTVKEKGEPLLGEAEILRKGLFDPASFKRKKTVTDKIRLFEGEDKTAEAEYVGAQIKRAMAQDNTLRYRDIAILCPSVLEYSLPLKRALEEYGIPYFIDEKKSLKRHPISRFLLDCFRVVKERFSAVSVQSLAENYFFGESDEYRNYLLKFANYRGGAQKDIKRTETVAESFDLQKLEDGKKRLLLATKNIKAKGHGRDYCNAVRKILIDFNVEQRLDELKESVGDIAQKGYLSQIYSVLEKVLLEAELLTGEKETSVAEFSSVLQDGLESAELSLIPLKSDAVFVGSIAESRIEKVGVLFAVGMTDCVPTTASDTAIISDKEMKRLAQVKTLLEPTVAQVNRRARESVCLNLCTFLQELHLSYPLSTDGSEPALSDVFRYIDALFCDENQKPLSRKQKKEEEYAYECSALTPAVRKLLTEKYYYENTKLDEKPENVKKIRERHSSIYSALDKLSVIHQDDFLQEGVETEYVQRGEELFFKNGRISPTALENYFSCPFQHFVERGLKLKDREERAVLAVDTGNFVHELLEKTSLKAKEMQTEEEMRAYARQVGAEILKKPVYSLHSDTAAGEFFDSKLLNEGVEVAMAAYAQIKNSEFEVEEVEKVISTPDFYGKVDRVDGDKEYLRIIDYKTGSIDDSSTAYYTGRKIQMQLYMSALKGERIPAGVFYFPAAVSFDEEDTKKFQMQGFLNGDEKALKRGDIHITEDRQSDYFPAALVNKTSKRVMEEDVFCDFLDYSVFAARQAKKELKKGFVKATPYAGACEYCKYGGMCGFQKGISNERSEASIDTATVANLAKKEREGKGE